MTTALPYLAFKGIGKTFPGVKALDDISFSCQAGQIHALMGENGAGKSTLLKILSGNYSPTQGEIQLQGRSVTFANTTDALDAGVAIIYQELHLVPEMTVAENIYLGYAIEIPVDRPVANGGNRQSAGAQRQGNRV